MKQATGLYCTLRVLVTPLPPSSMLVPLLLLPGAAAAPGGLAESTSTVNTTNELGGTEGGFPAAPYASAGEQVTVAF